MTAATNPTDDLGLEYWRWRAGQQPRTHDDIPRIDRPDGWLPEWSAQAVEGYRSDLASFERRLAELPATTDRAELVDRRLLASAFARVHWELDVLRMWQTQPRFYVDQTVGAVFDLLLPPAPDAGRLAVVASVLEATPQVLADARDNLVGQAVAEFAQAAIDELGDIETQLDTAVAALPGVDARLAAAAQVAGHALADFRRWLEVGLPAMTPMQPWGREAFQWFLTEVALIPATPEELLATGRAELERAITLETLERNKNRLGDVPVPRRSGAEQSELEYRAELQVREFLVARGLLSQPDTLQHYRNAPLPEYLLPLRWLGVNDDLTGPDRLDQDGVSYVPPFGEEIPYFYAANALDPRAGIVHEGAHYQQLSISWRHERPLRRHYYDSGANEGIAFYNEEMMLASGLFDDAPRLREVMYNFMRLRALRVEVDVRLAIGELDIAGATAYLRDVVPMDTETAVEEATFFAAYPGQAMTYQIGKSQILRLLADAVRAGGFDLLAFHDRLWREGNVPISLQRWELLDDDSDLRRIAQLRG